MTDIDRLKLAVTELADIQEDISDDGHRYVIGWAVHYFQDALSEIERLRESHNRSSERSDANADHARLANQHRDSAARALAASQARLAEVVKTLQIAEAVLNEFALKNGPIEALGIVRKTLGENAAGYLVPVSGSTEGGK